VMITDRAVRSLLVVVLVLAAAALALLLLGWLAMAGMMAAGMSGMMGGGMMGQGSAMPGLGIGVGFVALVVLAGMIAGLVWGLRSPYPGSQ
jgi:hypothetical protein